MTALPAVIFPPPKCPKCGHFYTNAYGAICAHCEPGKARAWLLRPGSRFAKAADRLGLDDDSEAEHAEALRMEDDAKRDREYMNQDGGFSS